MKVLVLSSRTGQALHWLHSLYPIHTVVSNSQPPTGLGWLPIPETEDEWKLLRALNFDVAISLGFMRHIPSVFFKHTLTINVHPGKLPCFKGKDPHLQALNAGAKQTAVTIHKVTEEIDCGEILVEVPVLISATDNPESLDSRLRYVSVYATAAFLHGME